MRATTLTVRSALAALMLTACAGNAAQTRPATPESASPPATTTPPATEAPAADAGAPVETAADVGPTAAPASDGGPAPAADATPAEPELPPMPTNLHGPPRPWARMNARARDEYMEHAVLPAMAELFRAYDPQEYAQVRCSTCHGQNARQVRFRMPNALPGLHAWGTPQAQQQAAQNPRLMRFMAERVTPAMAQLLGVPRYDPQTHQGFGCFNCHPHAQ
jgi:hypothetical protein